MRKQNSTNSENQRAMTHNCPITSTFEIIGGRWKIIIIWNLKDQPMRYNALKRCIPNISEKMLTQQLKSLVQDGWVDKKDYEEVPPKTEYSLTSFGASFLPILNEIYAWGLENNIVEKAASQRPH